jgi:hypothetical protein
MKVRSILMNTCLAAACACLATGTLALYRYGANLRNHPQRASQQPSGEADVRVDKVNAVLTNESKPELVLFLSTRCIHCQNSLPLYRAQDSRPGAALRPASPLFPDALRATVLRPGILL